MLISFIYVNKFKVQTLSIKLTLFDSSPMIVSVSEGSILRHILLSHVQRAYLSLHM